MSAPALVAASSLNVGPFFSTTISAARLPKTERVSLSERFRLGKGITKSKSATPLPMEGCQGGVLPLETIAGESLRASKKTLRSAAVSSGWKQRFSWVPFGRRKHNSMPWLPSPSLDKASSLAGRPAAAATSAIRLSHQRVRCSSASFAILAASESC